jgi:hypothetical protein
MAATHTDYKISSETVTAGAVIVRVRFYTGEYVTVDYGDGPVQEYKRTGGRAAERVLTFRPADYTRRKLTNYLDDQLHELNAFTNITEQTRKVTPSLAPTRAEVVA